MTAAVPAITSAIIKGLSTRKEVGKRRVRVERGTGTKNAAIRNPTNRAFRNGGIGVSPNLATPSSSRKNGRGQALAILRVLTVFARSVRAIITICQARHVLLLSPIRNAPITVRTISAGREKGVGGLPRLASTTHAILAALFLGSTACSSKVRPPHV